MNTCVFSRLFAGSSVLLFASGLIAQTTPPARPPNDQARDEIITLSEFSVRGDKVNGYVPTESTTGSRMAVVIKDLPYAISAITSQFVKDFGLLSLTDELAFSSSMNGLNDVGGFSLRGYGGNISLRNGFSRLGFFDPAVYDRIEFIKGPAASIYGQTNPGGIVNFVTKRPKSSPHESFTTTYGSYRLTRSEFELTGPVPMGTANPKLFYIIETAYDHRYYESPNQASTTRVAYLDLLYKFSPQTSLSFDFDWEYKSFTGGTSGTSLPEIFDTTAPAGSTRQWTGIAYELIHKYYTDASQWNHRTIFNYEAIFESKLSDVFSVRAAGDVYRSPRFSYSTGLTNQFDPLTRTLIGRNTRTNFSFLQGDGISGAVDAVAKYNVAGQGEQKTLFTVDYYKNIGKRPSWSTAAGTTSATFNVDNPVFTPYIPFNTAQYTIQSNAGGLLEDDYVQASGASLRHFGKFFHNKLTIGAGLRVDRVYKTAHALVGTTGNVGTLFPYPITSPTNWSKEIGLVYQINPAVNVYVNRAESFVPNSPANGSQVLSNQTGVGYEGGFKGSLFDGRFDFTTDVFDIKLDGVAVSEFDPVTNTTRTVASGTQYSKGYEFDGNWKLTKDVQLLGSYSYNKAYYGNQGVDLDLKGRQIVGVPKNQATGALAWDVMPGLTLTAKARYYDRFRVDNGTSTAAPYRVGGIQVANDGRRNIWGKSYTVVDVGGMYKWTGYGGLRQKIQLSFKNVFNKTYVIVGSRVVGDKFGTYVTYAIER
jgi:iron complex outermembrane recepter protein